MKSTLNTAAIISELARAYVAHTGLKESTVSTKVLNDGKRLKTYREGTPKGRSAYITPDRFTAALTWFDDNWPADLEWPNSIERPSVSARSQRRTA